MPSIEAANRRNRRVSLERVTRRARLSVRTSISVYCCGMSGISLAIVDNDELTLRALMGYLRSCASQISVTWAVMKGATAVRRCLDSKSRPDVLMVDMSLSDMNGVDVVHRIRRVTPYVPMLAITSFPLEQYARRVARAGAQGIIAKRNLAKIVAAVECVAGNGIWAQSLPNGIESGDFMTALHSHALLERADESDDSEVDNKGLPAFGGLPRLSAREQQILDMYAHGRTSVQVAELLGLSVNTVKTHTARVFAKLGVSNRGQAVAVWMSGHRDAW